MRKALSEGTADCLHATLPSQEIRKTTFPFQDMTQYCRPVFALSHRPVTFECAYAGVLPNGSGSDNQYTRSVDVFAFGLCVLELATTKKLDHTTQQNWAEVVELVQDKETKSFISRYSKASAGYRCMGRTQQGTAINLAASGAIIFHALLLVARACQLK